VVFAYKKARAANPTELAYYEDRIVSPEQIRIIGKVVL